MRSESVGSQKGAALLSKPPNSSCTRAAVLFSVRHRYHLRLCRTIGSLGILRAFAAPPPPSPRSELRASSEPPLTAGLACCCCCCCGAMPAAAAAAGCGLATVLLLCGCAGCVPAMCRCYARPGALASTVTCCTAPALAPQRGRRPAATCSWPPRCAVPVHQSAELRSPAT